MLTHIHIENFALIDALDLNLESGLTAITGETGAGKSILLGALGLVLGNRADLSAVRDLSKKCVVEAHFNIANLSLEKHFEELDLDFEKLTILRREIAPSGKSRAFVNDSPVTLSQLSALGTQLIDIHSQHQTMQLSADVFQVNVLNAYVNEQSKNLPRTGLVVYNEYNEQLQHYNSIHKALDTALQDEAILVKEFEYNTYLLEELEAVPLEKLDINALEEESQQLSNVETIGISLNEVVALLQTEETGVTDQLRFAQRKLQQISTYAPKYEELYARITSLLLELDDIQDATNIQVDAIEANPERLEVVNNLIATLENLLRKHQLNDINELITYRDELAGKVLTTQGLKKKIKDLQSSLQEAYSNVTKLGNELNALRQAAIKPFEKDILETVKLLGMPDAQFKVSLEKSATFLNSGTDLIAFRFTANKGTSLLPLDKAASGGELSRLMLAIKSLLSKSIQLPTIIFDEIDTGVSGVIASKMATIMEQMAHTMQVITITHLPQIAAAGKDHLFVRKAVIDNRTISQIHRLEHKERIEELAQMLSAGSISDAARENARELLK